MVLKLTFERGQKSTTQKAFWVASLHTSQYWVHLHVYLIQSNKLQGSKLLLGTATTCVPRIGPI